MTDGYAHSWSGVQRRRSWPRCSSRVAPQAATRSRSQRWRPQRPPSRPRRVVLNRPCRCLKPGPARRSPRQPPPLPCGPPPQPYGPPRPRRRWPSRHLSGHSRAEFAATAPPTPSSRAGGLALSMPGNWLVAGWIRRASARPPYSFKFTTPAARSSTTRLRAPVFRAATSQPPISSRH